MTVEAAPSYVIYTLHPRRSCRRVFLHILSQDIVTYKITAVSPYLELEKLNAGIGSLNVSEA